MSKYIIKKNKNTSNELISKETFFCVPNCSMEVITPFSDRSLYSALGINNKLREHLEKVGLFSELYLKGNPFAPYINDPEMFNRFYKEYKAESDPVNIRFFSDSNVTKNNVLNYYLPKTFKEDAVSHYHRINGNKKQN